MGMNFVSLEALVGTAGFEPTTLCPPGKCATRLRYAPTAAAIIRVFRRLGMLKRAISRTADHA